MPYNQNKYLVRGPVALAECQAQLHALGIAEEFMDLVAEQLDSRDQYFGKFAFMVDRVARDLDLDPALLLSAFNFGHLAKFLILSEKSDTRAPSSCYQYKSAAKYVLNALGRPLSEEADRLLNQQLLSYKTRWSQEVAIGLRPMPKRRGAINGTMVEQLAVVAEEQFPNTLLAEGFILLLCAGCRPQDIRDLTLNRILENDTKILAYAKGSTAKAIDTLGFNTHVVRTSGGRSALQRIAKAARAAHRAEDVEVIPAWNAKNVRVVIDAAVKRFKWTGDLKWVAHGIRHGATQDIIEDYENFNEDIEECDPAGISDDTRKKLCNLMRWKSSATPDTYRMTNRAEAAQAAKDSQRRYGEFGGANKKNKLRVTARNFRVRGKLSRFVPLRGSAPPAQQQQQQQTTQPTVPGPKEEPERKRAAKSLSARKDTSASSKPSGKSQHKPITRQKKKVEVDASTTPPPSIWDLWCVLAHERENDVQPPGASVPADLDGEVDGELE